MIFQNRHSPKGVPLAHVSMKTPFLFEFLQTNSYMATSKQYMIFKILGRLDNS
jgi:hypothetical protein